MSEIFTEMTRRYRENDLPWNVTLPPPEVLAIAEELSPGRMLDLGCGLGRATVYLAERGWQADGVDFVAQAIELARERAQAAGVAHLTRFYVSSVAEIDFLEPPYDLALDVGCLHSQPDEIQQIYFTQLARLLRPGGKYLLFVRMQQEADLPEGRWISDAKIGQLFSSDFEIERIEKGTSSFGGNVAPSAWLWMHRK